MYDYTTTTTRQTTAIMIAVCVILILLGISHAGATGPVAPTLSGITPQAGYNNSAANITNMAGANFKGPGATAELMPAGYPITPVQAGSLVNGAGTAKLDRARSVFVKGTTAYVASTGSDALEIVNIASPAAPAHLASITNGAGGALLDGAFSVYVYGNYAYVASRDSDALEIINIATPAAPVHVAALKNGTSGSWLDSPSAVFVANESGSAITLAYVVSTTSNALQIVDVTKPAAPVVRGSISNATGAKGNMSSPGSVYVSGNYAYITSELGNGLEIVDISNSWSPRHAGYIANGAGGALLKNPASVHVAGKYAYVASAGSNALEVIDVSNPKSPVHRASLVHGSGGAQLNNPRTLDINGIYAYVGSQNGNSIEVIDISNPAAPAHKGSLVFGTGYAPNGIFVSGDYAFVANPLHKSLETVRVSTGTVKATGLAVVSPAKITCLIPITGKPAGLYSVVVTNPDLQQAVLANAFMVSAQPAAKPEPFPGWKYRAILNNNGVYNDGGNRPNGIELWNVSDASQPAAEIAMIESTPAVSNGIVYVGDLEKHFYAIFANNGTVKWRRVLSQNVYSSPAIADGIVYIGTGNSPTVAGTLYALNASTGTTVWQKTFRGGVTSSPAVYNGTVYVGRMDHNLSAFRTTTGAEIWRFPTADSVDTSPAVANGRIIFATSDWNLFALDAISGRKVWDGRNSSGWDASIVFIGSSPAVSGGRVYIGGEYAFYSFDEKTGALMRKLAINESSYVYSSPAVSNGVVYFGTSCGIYGCHNRMYALNANTLAVKWVNYTPDNTQIRSSPAVANGVVYITSDRANNNAKGYLYAWNAATGAPVWNFLPVGAGGTDSSPVVDDGVVYFGTWWRGLYAIGTGHPFDVIIPNTNQSWKRSTLHTIQWTVKGNPGPRVRIELLKGSVVSRVINASVPAGTKGTGAYDWVVPYNQILGTDYKIRVSSTTNPALKDVSDVNFTISAGDPITVTGPNGGQNWVRNTIHPISWKYTGNPGASVKIELMKGAVVNRVIVPSTPIGAAGTGSYSWTIPAGQTAGSDYRIRVSSTANAALNDLSNAYFTISA